MVSPENFLNRPGETIRSACLLCLKFADTSNPSCTASGMYLCITKVYLINGRQAVSFLTHTCVDVSSEGRCNVLVFFLFQPPSSKKRKQDEDNYYGMLEVGSNAI